MDIVTKNRKIELKVLLILLNELNIKNSMIDSSCCGMAGSFGYSSKHYEVSKKWLIP